MHYSVLARKWRPRSLQEMVGQENIVTILTNALQQQRLHHAYLFCGTRGVGKTTLARILTKCLSCTTGPTATPCNQCIPCQQIDQGSYPDFIEIDAASRTKVEDTRELLDNVLYAPVCGKYKIYLIDEVHMLSGHSFNALLKTLEEPPAHVKFLLATTDPHKLPLTVLSRCLKLSLRYLSVAQISHHLAQVLTQENIAFEAAALTAIARAAQGSMRDALSLLDPALVFCKDRVTLDKVSQLLGTENATVLFDILEALIDKNSAKIFTLVQTIAEHNGDFLRAADDLLHLLYLLALYQKDPSLLTAEMLDSPQLLEMLPALSQKISTNDVQLLYQIGLCAKKDLPWAPTLRIGFEMLLLRALDFYPLEIAETTETPPVPPEQTIVLDAAAWQEIIPKLNLSGMTRTLAQQATIGKIEQNRLELILAERHRSLCQVQQRQRLESAIGHYVGYSVSIDFCFIESAVDKAIEQPKKAEMQPQGNLQRLLNMFDATIERG